MAADEPQPSDEVLGPYLERPPGERIPPGKFTYKVRGKNRAVERDWNQLCAVHTNNARRCFDHLARMPRGRPIDTGRVCELKGKLAGIMQYEVSGSGRLWYTVDEERRAVIVIRVQIGHPKETD